MNQSVDEYIGLHEGIPSADYHAAPGVSFTGFKHFLKSPSHYKAYLERPKEQTSAQKLGSLLHLALLEPEAFAETTVHMEGPLNTNPWKKLADEAKALGKIPIGHQMWLDITGMRDSVLSHDLAKKYIEQGVKELSGWWKDPETGVLRRFRPDIWIESSMTIVDVKTCGDVQTFPIIELMRNKYHVQTAWYCEGMSVLVGQPITKHVHLCVEDEYPYAVQCHALNDASIERAQLDIRRGLRRYAECKDKGVWPGPSPTINPVALPDWAWFDAMEGFSE